MRTPLFVSREQANSNGGLHDEDDLDLGVAAIGVAVAAPAWAATDAECQDMWKKADANSDGVLSDSESIRYVALMRVGNRTVATEGRITQAEFMDACKADIYAPRKADRARR